MKKNILMAVFCLILSAMSFAQVPQIMSYQAVVRGSDNNLVVNQQISMRVSILQGSADGGAVYTETHSATTNANGLVSIEIGNGTSDDDFSAINWANGPYFVKTETDVYGGENYEIVGVSQLLSVPYAMYAQSAGNIPDVSGFLSEETDPQFNAWDKDYNDLTNRPEIPTVPTNVSAFENDANYISSESQTLADVAVLGNSMNNNQIKNVANPTEDQDAVTKKYLDDIVAPILAQNASLQATIDSLSLVVLLGGHAFVDLGLPSGTLWATCNVGATTPEAYGGYYAWGETTTKTTYNWSNYRYCNGSSTTLTKYCYDANYGYNGFTDNLTTLQSSDDAATANWGNGWRMPTSTEMQELIDNCTFEWTTLNGVNGGKFTGTNGNSIFLPASGSRNGSNLNDNGITGHYVSSILSGSHTYFYSGLRFSFSSNTYEIYEGYRYIGRSVRAVYNPNDIGNSTPEPLDPSQQEYYTITFNANGGSGTMSAQTFTSGIAQSLNTNTFTKTGYNFAGWNTSANGSGTAYANGQSITITTDLTLYAQWEIVTNGTFTDSRDGISYKYVTIGSQTWMGENLRYTGNSASITFLGSDAVSTTARYRYYPNGDSDNVRTYGYLYNWLAANTACPNGWHLPTNAEWTQLANYLGTSTAGAQLAGGNWNSGSLTASSMFGRSGFDALPAGQFYTDFSGFGHTAYFWTATEGSTSLYAQARSITNNNTILVSHSSSSTEKSKEIGFSVRCVRNN